ncbi:phytoene dehydrogenase-like isoform X1 [Zingiber officinale]|uniref:phytoene dehydrogenase-like isoform X1 n=1 Tax=Zingiber officinale TaxID=94328 RepID=UPI001C4D9D89|nr:phytoene dehydrogenase-like isoform X1 [Zingiber officinale]
MWASAAPAALVATRFLRPRESCCRCCADSSSASNSIHAASRKKVVVVGAGWAGLASAHHLCKQGFEVTLLESGNSPAEEIGVKGFWRPYRNLFSAIDELGLQPFTKWTSSALYSQEGMEVKFPIFKDLTQLPTPLGALLYPEFVNLPLVDRLASVPLISAVIDFDNTDTAWRKYDKMTSRELFKQYGCSESLFQKVFEPMLHVGLFAPAEQCSAAATLAMLYYYILSHQQNFDAVWCRGTIQEKIFLPWLESMRLEGLKFCENKSVTEFIVDEDTGCVSGLVCGEEIYKADAIILAVGISTLQSTIRSSSVLQSRQEFLGVLNLATVDVVSVKLWFDRKVKIPNAANICSGFDDLISWTLLDLNSIYDEYQDEQATVLEVEIYCATQLLALKDEQIVAKVVAYLSDCIKDFKEAIVVQQNIVKHAKSATHFFPGSYKHMMRSSTTFPNLFVAGDWILNRHGSWSKEKAYVTGLEVANRVVDYLGEGEFAKIIAVEEDEAHFDALRSLNRRFVEIRSQLPVFEYFL